MPVEPGVEAGGGVRAKEPAASGAARPSPKPAGAGGAFWLYGHHTVLAAAANPRRQIKRLLATADGAAALQAAVALGGAAARPPLEIVDRETLNRQLPPQAVHQGLAALTEPLAAPTLDALIERSAPLPLTVVVLDQAEDPRNVGAVVRAAAAFAAGAVIVQDRHAPAETAALAKAASGGLETVPLIRVVNVARALRDLADAGYCCVGLDGAATEPLAAAMPDGPTALVLGSEGRGLRRLVREACQRLARIPIEAHIDSLNVATAAAVALYERSRGR